MEETPDTFGAYRLYERIGLGGMATVWLAGREGASELCVLKRLRADRDSDPEVRKRFVREAHLCTLLDHENIARVVDAGRVDDDFFIAFEYVSGISVQDVLTRMSAHKQLLPFAVTVAIADQLLAALAHAHAATDGDGAPMNLVHRDLSPANVMLGFDGRVKVIDFGIASARVDELKTSPGQVFGTMRYMSPDQALGQALDARSDLYTVSVVLYEMLSGWPVIPRNRKFTWKTAFQAILETRPAPLAEAAPTLPARLGFAVERGFAKTPDGRWPNAEAMREAIAAESAELGRVDVDGVAGFLQRHFEAERLEREAMFRNVTARAGLAEPETLPTRTHVAPRAPETQLVTRTAMHPDVDVLPTRAVDELRPTRVVDELLPTRAVDDVLPTRTVRPSAPESVRFEPALGRGAWFAFGAIAIAAALATIGVARWRFSDIPAPIADDAPPELVRLEPRVVGGPTVTPREPAVETATRAEADATPPPLSGSGGLVEPVEAPPRSPPPRPTTETKSPPPNPGPETLEALLTTLEAAPRDADLQARLYRRLAGAARLLPEPRRQRAEAAARRARRSGNLEAFADAVRLVSAP